MLNLAKWQLQAQSKTDKLSHNSAIVESVHQWIKYEISVVKVAKKYIRKDNVTNWEYKKRRIYNPIFLWIITQVFEIHEKFEWENKRLM